MTSVHLYLWLYQSFFSGADTNTFLDITFGIVAIVILLNVVVAIVDEAWYVPFFLVSIISTFLLYVYNLRMLVCSSTIFH